MVRKIIDEYTDLKMSRQRKWAKRNPDKVKRYQAKYDKSEKRKQSRAKRLEELDYEELV